MPLQRFSQMRGPQRLAEALVAFADLVHEPVNRYLGNAGIGHDLAYRHIRGIAMPAALAVPERLAGRQQGPICSTASENDNAYPL